jgi:hypothetical protein
MAGPSYEDLDGQEVGESNAEGKKTVSENVYVESLVGATSEHSASGYDPNYFYDDLI